MSAVFVHDGNSRVCESTLIGTIIASSTKELTSKFITDLSDCNAEHRSVFTLTVAGPIVVICMGKDLQKLLCLKIWTRFLVYWFRFFGSIFLGWHQGPYLLLYDRCSDSMNRGETYKVREKVGDASASFFFILFYFLNSKNFEPYKTVTRLILFASFPAPYNFCFIKERWERISIATADIRLQKYRRRMCLNVRMCTQRAFDKMQYSFSAFVLNSIDHNFTKTIEHPDVQKTIWMQRVRVGT